MPRRTSLKSISVPVPPPLDESRPLVSSVRRFPWRWILVVLAILAVGLIAANKGWIVVALVDGRPIYSWQLNHSLRTRFGQQTLEGMIGEMLIVREAGKSGVTVTEDDLKMKQKEILSSLGQEVNLSDFLKFQGLSESDFYQQLKMQLLVERLLTKDLTITEKDVDNFIATNRAVLVATTQAELREEAKRSIISSTVSEKIQLWFTELRKASNVMKFL